eukprot:6477263-Amphidinium_carterae.3
MSPQPPNTHLCVRDPRLRNDAIDTSPGCEGNRNSVSNMCLDRCNNYSNYSNLVVTSQLAQVCRVSAI